MLRRPVRTAKVCSTLQDILLCYSSVSNIKSDFLLRRPSCRLRVPTGPNFFNGTCCSIPSSLGWKGLRWNVNQMKGDLLPDFK